MKRIVSVAVFILLNSLVHASDSTHVKPVAREKLNFFIVSRPKKGKLDAASRFNIVRTRVREFCYPNKFVAIVAYSADQMERKVIRRLNRRHAEIGTLW